MLLGCLCAVIMRQQNVWYRPPIFPTPNIHVSFVLSGMGMECKVSHIHIHASKIPVVDMQERKAVTNLLNNESVSDVDRLRLVMLYALRYEKESPVQLMQLFNKLASRSPKYKPGLVQFLLKQAGVDKRTGDLYGNRDLLNIARNMARGLKGVENVYTQHQPLLFQTMESIIKGRLRDVDYPFIGNHFQQGRPQEVVIFIVGGTTYEESRSVALQNATNSGIRFILGGSVVLNSKRFLKDLEEARRIARTSTTVV
ncbi:hypothetical protein TEA_023457 [Camellia sinensis var. sinensis]|uniref:Uncharacterized protein n=1 Tax=Camellia sinensis var. sinensis TaxID=542762 RepID=A0A4S4DM40_CAMSN|nr:hypothetical protein TEA_023457 [Camellia sinensis var. sinensis]